MVAEAAVRPVLIVVADAAIEHSSEMSLVHHEETVGALRSHRSHPALGDRVRVGRAHRTPHDARTLPFPHSIEKKSQATMPAACRRKNLRHVVKTRRGAGSMPFALSTLAMVLAATRCARLKSSPQMR